jgi:hypothetical protein
MASLRPALLALRHIRNILADARNKKEDRPSGPGILSPSVRYCDPSDFRTSHIVGDSKGKAANRPQQII